MTPAVAIVPAAAAPNDHAPVQPERTMAWPTPPATAAPTIARHHADAKSLAPFRVPVSRA